MSQRAAMQWRTEREATGSRGAWSVRAFDPERDADAVSHLDISYTTSQAYAVHRSGDVVALAPTASTAPHSARAAIDPQAGPQAGPQGGPQAGPGAGPSSAAAWTHARVAVLDGRVRGFLAWRCESSGRMTIVQFHVDRLYRQRGGGRRLLDDALDGARRDGATLAWLEMSSANHPAITAMRRLGFEICGFDTTLYRGTPHQGEIAVFMAHPIDGDARG